MGHLCCDFIYGVASREAIAKYLSRRYRKVGRAKQIPTKKMAQKCHTNPFIRSRLDSAAIQKVHAVAVKIKSQLKPEITHVAKGAAKNSLQAESPRYKK